MTAPAVHETRISVESFDVDCLACGTTATIVTGRLELFTAAHRQPVLRTFYARIDGGPVTVWHCSRPKPLR